MRKESRALSFMNDENVPVLSPTKKFQVNTCGGILWVVIIIVGFLAMILGSIGSPHTLGSKNSFGSLRDPIDFYGYGLGYIKEPLNVVFIVIVILTWLYAVVFGVALFLQGTRRVALILSPILCGLFGAFLIVAVICGSYGTFKFWEGCCNITPPDTGDTAASQFYRYRRSSYFPSGHPEGNWCRCTYVFNADDSGTVQEDRVKYNQDFVGKQFVAAWPHHFLVHVFALGFAFIDAILHFVAICVI